LMLNLKEVAVRTTEGAEAMEQPLMLRVERKGKGELTAADIETPPEVEIVNRGLHIATLTSDDASLEMEMRVRRGTGYVPAEDQDRSEEPLGTIPLDCIFSPVRKVSYRVEPTRVGRLTNYDRLILEVLTNGTIAPGDAVSEAAKILDRYLLLFFDFAEQKEKPAAAPGAEGVQEGVLDTRVEDLGLSVRAVNCLLREQVQTVRQLADKTEEELMSYRAFGRGCLAEVQEKLASLNLSLKQSPEDGGDQKGKEAG
jgi:DNA-directed RNA polymerase subunit alpha